MTGKPYEIVDNPTPSVARYGLVRSAVVDIDDQTVPHWGGGITWARDPLTGTGAALDPDALPGTFALPGTVEVPSKFTPYTVWEAVECSTLDQVTDLRARASRKLLRTTSKQVAQEFLYGTRAVAASWSENFYLWKSPDLLNASTATPSVYALGWLQKWLVSHYEGSPGMIHAPVEVVNHWVSVMAVFTEPNGGLFYDAFGNIVVPDPGYDGGASNGVVDATHKMFWCHATGMVKVMLSSVDLESPGGYIDRATNTRQHIAVRYAATLVDPVAAAIKVDICQPLCTP